LNATINARRLKRNDDTNASSALMSTAAGPPESSRTRKTNVSETEICELKRGIGIVMRDVSSKAIATNTAK